MQCVLAVLAIVSATLSAWAQDGPSTVRTLEDAARRMSQAEEALGRAAAALGDSLRKVDGDQEESIRLLNELIRSAKDADRFSRAEGAAEPRSSSPPAAGRSRRAAGPAPQPYDAQRTTSPGEAPPRTADPATSWGHLQPRFRERVAQSERAISQYPAAYRELLEDYFEAITR